MTTETTPTPCHKQQKVRQARHLGAPYHEYRAGQSWQCPETLLKEHPELSTILPPVDPNAPPDRPPAHFWQINDRSKTEHCAKCGKTRPIVPTIFYCLTAALVGLIHPDLHIADTIDVALDAIT